MTRKARLDAKGMLVVPASVTRVGVFRYRRADGSVVRELRHPDDVFEAESLATLRGASVTVNHTAPEVRADNVGQHEVGVVMSEGERSGDGRHVDTELYVRRADAVAKVRSRELVETSCGYDCDVEPAPAGARYDGEEYDVRQRRIRYNHVALLPPGGGRAGRTARMHLDSEDAVLLDADNPPSAPEKPAAKERTMPIRIDGVEYECPDQTHQVVSRKLDALEQTAVKAQEDRDAAVKRADGLAGELEATKKALAEKDDPTRLDALVSERVAILDVARSVLPKETKLDGLTNRQVQEAVVKHMDSSVRLDGESDDFVQGMFRVHASRVSQASSQRSKFQAPAPTAPAGDPSPGNRNDADEPEGFEDRYQRALGLRSRRAFSKEN